MLRKIFVTVAIVVGTAQPLLAASDVNPEADRKAFVKNFTDRFPKVPLKDFVNGPYSMDAGLHKQWEAKEEFPPYEFAVEKGKQMFNTPFKNGKTYGDCFPNKGIGIRQNYPKFDTKSGKVITLEEGRYGGDHRLYGFHLARQGDGHQDPERPARARRLQEG